MRVVRRLLLVAAGLVSVWLLLCHYRYDQVSLCSSCGASQFRSRWYVGLMPLGVPVLHDFGSVHGPGAFPVTLQTTRTNPSPATIHLYSSGHSHDWHFAGANPFYLFGTRWGGCVTGGERGPSSAFAFVYLQDPAFVAYVEALIRNGSYMRSDVRSLFEGRTSDSLVVTDHILDRYWRSHPDPDRTRVYRAIFHPTKP